MTTANTDTTPNAPDVRADKAEYDEVDRRLIDTFPASDAVGRY